jgi:hypothetical protein
MTKLYIAYGSNMNRAQMARRCPKAKAVRAIIIDDARLVFRGVADLEYHQGASVPVVLWEITDECERALDRFEGVAQGIYEKKMIPLDNGEQALVYVICRPGIAPPQRDYYERIKQGYADFELDPEPLDVALKHSHVNTQHSAETRRRLARNMAAGNTQIARRPMHIPLEKAQDAPVCDEPELPLTPQRCRHNLLAEHCLQCRGAGRPLDGGYNWSPKARANSEAMATKQGEINGKRRGKKDGKPTGRKVQHDGHDFETPAHRAAHIQTVVRNRPKANKSTNTMRYKNLSEYMKAKGYTN